MPKNLAITIAGAVSLGSYEAGVLYETLDAIHIYNTALPEGDPDRIVIDVLTGASAGGMTAIILAQKLLYSAWEFKGPYENPLYSTWVEGIDITRLQTTQNNEPALHSLFSSNLIVSIATDTLLLRYADGPPAPAIGHAAVGESIRVGVAMTNLNGVVYRYEVTPSGEFAYIDYRDQLTREVTKKRDACDSVDFWTPLRDAAVACGAFPIAFRARNMERSASLEPVDYPTTPRVGEGQPWHPDPAAFSYSDGGILQNQPLGMAKNLVDLIDPTHVDQKRFYLFVSPNEKDPKADDSFHEDNADYFNMLKRLASVVIGQAGFQDWITAKGVNERVNLLDKRADGLRDAIIGSEIDVSCLETTAAALLDLLFKDNQYLSPGAKLPESRGAAQDRIASQYMSEISTIRDKFPGGPGLTAANAFRDAVLAFETAAGLGARDHMTIYGVTATDAELAGAGLQAFLGFFDQDYRDHDYDVGRSKARQVLRDRALTQKDGLFYRTGSTQDEQDGGFQYLGHLIRAIHGGLAGSSYRNLPPDTRHTFKAALRSRINEMLREHWGAVGSIPEVLVVDGIFDVLADELLNKL